MKALIFALFIASMTPKAFAEKGNLFDELDPRSPDIEKLLQEVDEDYEKTTGKSSHIYSVIDEELDDLLGPSCYRNSCAIWADVD